MVVGTREELFCLDKKYKKWPENEIIEVSLEGKALTEGEVAQLIEISKNENFKLHLTDYPSNEEIPAALVNENIIEIDSQNINKTEKKKESGVESLDEGIKELNESFLNLQDLEGFNREKGLWYLEEEKKVSGEAIEEVENSIPKQEGVEWTEDDDIELGLTGPTESKKFDDQQEIIKQTPEIENIDPEKYKYTNVEDLVELSKQRFQRSHYYEERNRLESEKKIIAEESKFVTTKQINELSQKIASKTQKEREKLSTNKEEREKLVEELLMDNKDRKDKFKQQLDNIDANTKAEFSEKIEDLRELEANEGRTNELIDKAVGKLIQNIGDEWLQKLKRIEESKKELLEGKETYQDVKDIFLKEFEAAENSSNELRKEIIKIQKGTFAEDQKKIVSELKNDLLNNENLQTELLKKLEEVEEAGYTLAYQIRTKSQERLTEKERGSIDQLKSDLLDSERSKSILQESLKNTQKLHGELEEKIEAKSQGKLTNAEMDKITELKSNLEDNKKSEEGLIEKLEAVEKNERIRNELLGELLIENKDSCDIYLMSSFPKGSLGQYKNSYISVGESVRYVTFNGKYEHVTINDPRKFSESMRGINSENKDKLHLTGQQVDYLITSNGGHTRENKDVTKNKDEIRELLRHKKQLYRLEEELNAEKKKIEKQKEPWENRLNNSEIEQQELELSKNEMEKVAKKLIERVGNELATDATRQSEKLNEEPLTQIEISLENQFLTKDEVKLLADTLKDKDFDLGILRLKNCNLDDEDVKTLMEALKSHPRDMQVLDLSGNAISDTTAREIATVLSHINVKQINQVFLNNTQIGDEGIKELVLETRNNRRKVQALCCEGDNKITVEGAKNLINVLAQGGQINRFFELHVNVTADDTKQAKKLAETAQSLHIIHGDKTHYQHEIIGVPPAKRFYREWRGESTQVKTFQLMDEVWVPSVHTVMGTVSLPEKLNQKINFLTKKYPENAEIKALVSVLREISQKAQEDINQQIVNATANGKHTLTSKQAKEISNSIAMQTLRATEEMVGKLLKGNKQPEHAVEALTEYVTQCGQAMRQQSKRLAGNENPVDKKTVENNSNALINQKKAKASWLTIIMKILGRALHCMPVFCPAAGKFMSLINQVAQNNPVRALHLLMKKIKEKPVMKPSVEEKETLSLPQKLEKKINSLSEKYPMDKKFQELTSSLKIFVTNVQHSFASVLSKEEKISQNPAVEALEATDKMTDELLKKPNDPAALVTAVNQYSNAVNHAADKQGGELENLWKNEAKSTVSCVLACLPKICPKIAKFMDAVNIFVKSDPMHALYLLTKKLKPVLPVDSSQATTSAPSNQLLLSMFKSGGSLSDKSGVTEDKNNVESSVVSRPSPLR